MRLLLLDSEDVEKYLKHLIYIMKLDWKVFSVRDSFKAHEIYSSTTIDMLIVDFSVKEYKGFLEEIVKKDPFLKTITISDILHCSNTQGCESCVKSFNRKRIVKPVNMKELYDTIINFDTFPCRYFLNFENVVQLLPKIIENYNFCKYDPLKRIVECDEHHISSLISITELLDSNNISYELDENKVFIK